MTPDERADLLAIARAAIATFLGQPSCRPDGSRVDRRAGAFVTLHTAGRLRGCVGHVEADKPIVDVVASCAVAAASTDPRFPPVTAGELESVAIEISVLGLFEPVAVLADIVVGRHGLLVEDGPKRGLLLPQVAIEWQWDVAQLVAQTCLKAGLPADAWPTRGARVWRFEAEVFGE